MKNWLFFRFSIVMVLGNLDVMMFWSFIFYEIFVSILFLTTIKMKIGESYLQIYENNKF